MNNRSSFNIRLILGSLVLGLIIAAALFAPFLTPYVPGKMDITQRLLAPGPAHWLGTDLKGIDVWTSLLYGARISLSISFATVVICTLLGSSLGLIAGYFRGWFEIALMRTIDVLMAFPGMILSLTFATLLVPTYFSLVFAISITGWIGSARLIRGEVLSLREREYIVAAKALGASPISLLLKHLLPPLLPIIFAQMITSISGIILVESGLSFLGLGPRGKIPTWGQLLSEGRTVIIESPILAIAPGLAIFLVILSVNLIGDSFRDWLDPRKSLT